MTPMLMKRHGLSYGLWRVTFSEEEASVTSRLKISRAGAVRERPEVPKPLVLHDFIMAAPDYVVELLNGIEANVGRQLEGLNDKPDIPGG